VRSDQILTDTVFVDGEFVGMLTADAVDPSPAEIRRLLSVLASQIGLVLGRLRLVSALDRQAETMDAILRHSPVGVVLENGEGRVIYANPAIERIYGVAAQSMIGHPVERLLMQARANIVAQPEAAPGGPIELRLGEKGKKIVQVRRVPVPTSRGQQGGSLTLHEDVTEERTILDAKDLMLRAVGHEVRSPAAAMRATIASLLQWDHLMEPAQRRGVIEDAYDQSERLLNLVEAQLTIAKLEAGGFQPTTLPVALRETASQVQRVLSNRYGARVGAVEFHFPAVPDARCEPTHLEQALTNLIGNALEHAWATKILVTARRQGDWLEVSIKDNGRGLPSDRVTALFSRSAAGQSRARGGLGLGLYLCRLIVERSFGGRVWLDKTGPRGSTFKFTVPASTSAAGTAPAEQVDSDKRRD
jgi:PAS domain S-box-containing protein